MPPPVAGGAPASSPLPGHGDGGSEPSAPGGGGQPSAPTGDSGGQPSMPTGGDSGDIQAPDNNSGNTDYDQPAPGSAQTPALIEFTPAQGGIVNRAYQHVKRMIDSALDKLESGHPDSNFARWFGSPTQRNVQKVEQVFTRMQHAMSHDRFTFVLGAAHDNSELAHVQSSSPHQINLKPHFFDHAFGANTPEATIAHELSHFPYIGNTKDHLYGPAAVAGLAARNSDIATDNAENYGMFIRAQATA
ncbi:M35 family metallo-endopeptidase [Paraburkholderia sp. RL17-381-BIF-C]|uniref:M35 family metallo-endopeptidase n=1 Tax=Paraburkholderia sp. RL17-381-BIF-C TaxID=3031635 RepID=UPI0038B80C0B